jgi:hypothetical protein
MTTVAGGVLLSFAIAIIMNAVVVILNIPPSFGLSLGFGCVGAGSYMIGSQILDPYIPRVLRRANEIEEQPVRLQWE